MRKKLSVKQELLAEMLQESITRSDFEGVATQIAGKVKNIENKNLNDLKIMADNIKSAVNEAKNTNSSDFASHKDKMTRLIDAFMARAEETLKEKIGDIDYKISLIENGKDGTNGTNGINGKDGKKVNERKLKKDLKKYIDKLIKKLPKAKGGEVGGLRPADTGVETPSGAIDGANKAYTVSFVPQFITIQGQALYDGGGFTLGSAAGVLTITLDTAMETGEVIRSHY